MPLCWAKPRLKSDSAAVVCYPFRAGAQITPMLRLCRDTREPDVIAKFANEPSLVLLKITDDRLHLFSRFGLQELVQNVVNGRLACSGLVGARRRWSIGRAVSARQEVTRALDEATIFST